MTESEWIDVEKLNLLFLQNNPSQSQPVLLESLDKLAGFIILDRGHFFDLFFEPVLQAWYLCDSIPQLPIGIDGSHQASKKHAEPKKYNFVVVPSAAALAAKLAAAQQVIVVRKPVADIEKHVRVKFGRIETKAALVVSAVVAALAVDSSMPVVIGKSQVSVDHPVTSHTAASVTQGSGMLRS